MLTLGEASKRGYCLSRRNEEVMQKIAAYRELRSQFAAFLAAMESVLPANNAFETVVTPISPTFASLRILDQACEVGLQLDTANGREILGRAVFERVFNRPERRHVFFTLYFDRLGNASTTRPSNSAGWLHSLKNPNDLTNHLLIALLAAFFEDNAIRQSADEVQPTPVRVPR